MERRIRTKEFYYVKKIQLILKALFKTKKIN